jgi:plastocyanin
MLTVLSVFNSSATTVIIHSTGTTPQDEEFNPNIANAVCGDTIRWINLSGTHTTASTTIPAGATAWSSPNLNSTGYIYVVTVAGTYNYTCHPANGGHMDASIIVTCGVDVPKVADVNSVSVFPNPTSGKIRIDMGNSTSGNLKVYNVTGQIVLQTQIAEAISEAYLNLKSGIYYYELENQNSKLKTGKLLVQTDY